MSVFLPGTYLNKIYCKRTEIERLLMLSSLFSICLVIFRILYTGQLLFLGLVWNLFLAFVPYVFSSLLFNRQGWMQTKWMFWPLAIIWLLFIPNSFYIITDLFHLEPNFRIPLWFDLALIFSFAWNGLLLGILSVRQMEKIWETKWQWGEVVFIYPVMWLNAFGIYIGRYLRYNSWDVISNPWGLSEDILYLIIHPIRNRFDWSMIFCYSVFMTLIYLSVKKLSKAVWA